MKHSSIKEILDLGGEVVFQITAADLREVIRSTVLETKRLLEAEIVKDKEEFLLTAQDTLKRLSISRKTLYNWEKKGYLRAVEIGGKHRYKLSDINKIIKDK